MDLWFRKLSLPLSVALLTLTASIRMAATTPIETHVSIAAETKTVGADSTTRVADIGATHLRLSSMFSQCAATDVAANSRLTIDHRVVGDANINRNMAITIAQRHRISVGVVARVPRRVSPSCRLIAPPTTADLVARIPPLRI